jgi:hypothetical protein
MIASVCFFKKTTSSPKFEGVVSMGSVEASKLVAANVARRRGRQMFMGRNGEQPKA